MKTKDTIVHSLNNEMYLKQLDRTDRFNYQAPANLRTTLKETALRDQEGFQEVASKLTTNNKLIEAIAVMWHLEFAVTQLEMSTDEFVDALQYLHLGRRHLNLVSPTTLRELWKNISLTRGLWPNRLKRPNNAYLHYDVI